jgi:hypothetical protein
MRSSFADCTAWKGVGEALTKDKKSKAGCFKFCASLEVILKEYLVGYRVAYGEVWSKWRGGTI